MSVNSKIVLNALVAQYGVDDFRPPNREELKYIARINLMLQNPDKCQFIDEDTVDLEEEIGEYDCDALSNEDWEPTDESKKFEKKLGDWTIGSFDVTTERVMNIWKYYICNSDDPNSKKRRPLSSMSHIFK